MNQKGFSSILIVVIALIIIIGAGGYFILKQQKEKTQPQQSPQQSAEISPTQNEVVDDERLGWKTYRNNQFGYEFKLPKEMVN